MSSASVDSIWSCIWRDQLILAHSDMVERLGIAVGEGLQVGAVEHPPGDELGEDDQQAVGVGDGAGDQRLVDHRQPLVAVDLSASSIVIHGLIMPCYAPRKSKGSYG